jgi:hypothetical protein
MDEHIDTLNRSRQALADHMEATERRVSQYEPQCDSTTLDSTPA